MKDHFAGSVAAIELLNHLISSHRGKTHEQFLIRLRDQVVEDQEVLRGLLHDLDAEGGALRNPTAFLSEKLARIKLLLENPTGGQLARLEKLEALALGIEGKQTLWCTLLAVARKYQLFVKWIFLDWVNALTTSASASKLVESRRREKPLCLQNLAADLLEPVHPTDFYGANSRHKG